MLTDDVDDDIVDDATNYYVPAKIDNWRPSCKSDTEFPIFLFKIFNKLFFNGLNNSKNIRKVFALRFKLYFILFIKKR